MKYNFLKAAAILTLLGMLTACGNEEVQTEAVAETSTEIAATEETEVATEIMTEALTEAATEIETTTVQTEATTQEAVIEEESRGLSIAVNGKAVCLNDDISALALGEATDYYEAPSCNYDGLDKVFTYNEVSVYTYPKDGKDLVNEVEVNAAGILYENSLGIGSAEADVKALLGEPSAIEGDTYRYAFDNSYLYFYFEDNSVSYWGIALDM